MVKCTQCLKATCGSEFNHHPSPMELITRFGNDDLKRILGTEDKWIVCPVDTQEPRDDGATLINYHVLFRTTKA